MRNVNIFIQKRYSTKLTKVKDIRILSLHRKFGSCKKSFYLWELLLFDKNYKDLDWFVIMEDDAKLPKNFLRRIEKLLKH